MGPNTGDYDGRKASFYAPSRTNDSVTNEPKVTFPTVSLTRYIRFMRVVGREGTTLNQIISDAQVILRVRRDSGTEGIRPDWRIVHDGFTYGIISVNPIPRERDEIELLCSRVNL